MIRDLLIWLGDKLHWYRPPSLFHACLAVHMRDAKHTGALR